MKKRNKTITYTIGSIVFFVSFILMIYYGKETFYVKDNSLNEEVYNHHFVLITEEVGNDYWRLIENGAREAAANHQIYLEYIGPRHSDIDEKLQTFDRMISANVDGIIVQGLPGERFKRLVDKAQEQHIPVVTVDTDVPESARNFYVGTDNYQAGYLAGETLISDTTGEIYVGVVMGMLDALNQRARVEGFKDAIEKVDRIKLVDIAESNITEIGAVQASYSLLKQYPEINALFGSSALDGIGIVQAIKEKDSSNDLHVIAFDTLPETLDLIEKGDITATIVQYPFEMGKEAVELMVKLQNNESVNQTNYTKTGVLRKKNIKNGEIVPTGDPL